MYLTLLQAAEELDRTERQVRYLVKTGVLVPVNQDTYKRDGGYRFSKEVVDQTKEKLIPEGISLRKAASIVGITPQYLNTLAMNGQINSQLVLIGNKKERRFNEDDCLNFKIQLSKRTHKKIAHYGEKLHLFRNDIRLFDLIDYKGDQVRIVKTEPITLLKIDGTLVHLLSTEGLATSEEWAHKPYKTKKGFITFRFPIPRNPEHLTYNILFNLIEGLGPKNVQVFEQSEGDYYIRCRQGKLFIQPEFIDVLNRYVVEGELSKIGEDKIELQSDIISQYIHLPRELYIEVEQLAQQQSISAQKQLIEIVVRGLKSFQSDK